MRKLLFQSLLQSPLTEVPPARDDAALAQLAKSLDRTARRRLGRSLSIRQVDAGSCNGCELEIHALNNAFYDLERFGLRFVASPRHADVLMVTGPVTKNMREALERTYLATPRPTWVVAVGDCAHDGGIFAGGYACVGGVSAVVPVDLHIRGCPPNPTILLQGLIALLESVVNGDGGVDEIATQGPQPGERAVRPREAAEAHIGDENRPSLLCSSHAASSSPRSLYHRPK
jgi:Ni,Fe-hydrogenase III small subunit